MSVLLHLSDTHFGTEQPPVVEALLRLASDVRPDIAILSGDVTQRAHRWQFAAARRFIEALAVPVKLVIPGNHDIPLFNLAARVFYPYANYCHAFGTSLDAHFSSDDLFVRCINTTRPWRHKDGEISRAQIREVARQLETAKPQQLRVIAVHQPVQVIRDSDSDNLLHGHREAAKVWAAAGADLILSGHIHIPYVRMLQTTQSGSPRPAWVVSAGTAVSKRIREGKPNSVNLIRYEPTQTARYCIVEQLDFHAASARFLPAKTTRLELA